MGRPLVEWRGVVTEGEFAGMDIYLSCPRFNEYIATYAKTLDAATGRKHLAMSMPMSAAMLPDYFARHLPEVDWRDGDGPRAAIDGQPDKARRRRRGRRSKR